MTAATVLRDLATLLEPPSIVIDGSRRQPARVDLDLTQSLVEATAEEMAEVLQRASEKASARRFCGEPPATWLGSL